jgi:hypothetical protein
MRLLPVLVLAAVLAAGCDRPASPPPPATTASAEGFEPVASNRYHPEGRATGRFDILLPPSRP